jgi:hypothetical protein
MNINELELRAPLNHCKCLALQYFNITGTEETDVWKILLWMW